MCRLFVKNEKFQLSSPFFISLKPPQIATKTEMYFNDHITTDLSAINAFAITFTNHEQYEVNVILKNESHWNISIQPVIMSTVARGPAIPARMMTSTPLFRFENSKSSVEQKTDGSYRLRLHEFQSQIRVVATLRPNPRCKVNLDQFSSIVGMNYLISGDAWHSQVFSESTNLIRQIHISGFEERKGIISFVWQKDRPQTDPPEFANTNPEILQCAL
jgi:hypothetical protein